MLKKIEADNKLKNTFLVIFFGKFDISRELSLWKNSLEMSVLNFEWKSKD